MKNNFQVNPDILRTIFLIAAIILACNPGSNAQSFKLYAVSDLQQVFGDGYKTPIKSDTLKLFGIRGEIISGQMIIIAGKDLQNITVEAGPLKNAVSQVKSPDLTTDWSFVGSIMLKNNTPNQPVNALVRPAPALYPDYLLAEKQLNIKGKSTQPVWLTVNIPEDAAPGTYSGRIEVRNGNENGSLPVYVTVYPLTLPSERHLKIVEWYTTSRFPGLHGINEPYSKEWFDMLKIYAANMAAHRQNVFRVSMDLINISRSDSNELEFDFTRFDQVAEVFWNTGKMDWLETGFLAKFGKGAWFSTEVLLDDFTVKDIKTGAKITMKGEEVVPYLLPEFESHLRQKGWLHKTYFHTQDEPSMHNAVSWMKMSSYLHQFAPELRRMDAIETTYLLDEIEVAVPKLDALAAWYDNYKDWQAKGNELWFYTVGIYQASRLPNKTIDMPVMNSRIMHWLNYRYGITGYLHWGWNQWTENPYVNPDIHIGDGWHVYPVKDGVLNSLRWEQMRNGIQDYEYFWMLENKITNLKDSLGSRFSWIDPKQRGKEIAGEVVSGFAEHTDDPEVLYAAKMKLINELLDFEKSPGIYIQTNPVEGSCFTDRSSVEIRGWTEPGTLITINGREVPVSKQGLFLEQINMSSKEDLIRVQATGSKGHREIVRKFNVIQ
jgi:hypothetical protein